MGNTFEFCDIHCSNYSKKVVSICIYRPPSGGDFKLFLELFRNLFCYVIARNCDIIMGGDFNLTSICLVIIWIS